MPTTYSLRDHVVTTRMAKFRITTLSYDPHDQTMLTEFDLLGEDGQTVDHRSARFGKSIPIIAKDGAERPDDEAHALIEKMIDLASNRIMRTMKATGTRDP